VEGRRGVWLRLVCDWLGGEFASLRATINQRVEMFKADNIHHISDLPSPAAVVRHLFPHCMTMLMLRWMNSTLSSDNVTLLTGGNVVGFESVGDSLPTLQVWKQSKLDHSYVISDCQQPGLFSFIQLILEFANGCLVSGISHVLYPRLLQAQL